MNSKEWFSVTLITFLIVYLIFSTRSPVKLHHLWQSTSKSAVTWNIQGKSIPEGFLVWSNQCMIVSLDPLAKDVLKLYHRRVPISCGPNTSLTTVEWSPEDKKYRLMVADTARTTYQFQEGHCQYQEVIRSSEDSITKTQGVNFTSSIELPLDAEFLYVKCFRSVGKEEVYKNVHFVVQRKSLVVHRLTKLAKIRKRKVPSVLMIGIDSISRLNLFRSMPNTAAHLQDSGWFDMKGYNKMGDNTFPNLMAVMTGFNLSWAYSVCQPKTRSGLDECPLIWKDFAEAGFVTGYAEDEPDMSTFNYLKKGFSKPPTDFYARPGILKAYQLKRTNQDGLAVCLGDQPTADFVYQYGMDVAERFQDEGSFGLYWTNSFSHNDMNTPSIMDERMKGYLEDIQRRGILRDTIIFFFADHGMRFGPVRDLVTGWMEERLPFLFIWLPEWFQNEHPEIVHVLRINQNRLTNPYDLHLTLKHIVRMSGRSNVEEKEDVAKGCANCQSMFREIPRNRSCRDIEIDDHWCTCAPFTPISTNATVVDKVTDFLMRYLNDDIAKSLNGTTKANGDPLCATLELKSVVFAGKVEYNGRDYSDILIQFWTKPGSAHFESTLRYTEKTQEFMVTGVISRLNAYGQDKKCVKNKHLEKYCECTPD